MRILILHNEPADFQRWLSERCQTHTIGWATRPQEVESTLLSLQPEAVLSIKHSDFPGESHRCALQWPSVKWFHVGGSGTEHLGSWDAKRVTVTNSVGVLAPFHAERAMGGLLALSTGLLDQRRAQQQKCWQPTRFVSLKGRTLLIVGVGRTGRELAVRAKSFGMHVVGVRASGESLPEVDEMYTPDRLGELWGRAEVVSLNLRASERTRNICDARALAVLPESALLLNGSRGSVLDTEALIDSLKSGHIAGAWLDVFEQEPLAQNSELWSMENVLVSAHCADQVSDFPLRFAQLFVENLKRFVGGEPLLNQVS